MMLKVGDLIENTYSHLKYKIERVVHVDNYWVKLDLKQIETDATEPRSLSVWMLEGEEAPRAFRKVEGKTVNKHKPKSRKKQEEKQEKQPKCRHCGSIGNQYFFEDNEGEIKSTRCYICGTENYRRDSR